MWACSPAADSGVHIHVDPQLGADARAAGSPGGEPQEPATVRNVRRVCAHMSVRRVYKNANHFKIHPDGWQGPTHQAEDARHDQHRLRLSAAVQKSSRSFSAREEPRLRPSLLSLSSLNSEPPHFINGCCPMSRTTQARTSTPVHALQTMGRL